jgi:hypothetical protein
MPSGLGGDGYALVLIDPASLGILVHRGMKSDARSTHMFILARAFFSSVYTPLQLNWRESRSGPRTM